MKFLQTKNYELRASNGFTLLELLVTIGIFIILTTMVIANYPRFYSQVSVGRIAREIALLSREAQAFGLAVRQKGGAFPVDYGIYVSEANNKEVIVFSEEFGSENHLYDEGDGCGGSSTECVSRFSIRGRIFVRDLCAIRSDVPETQEDCDIGRIDVVFRRANPDALIYLDADNSQEHTAAFIKLQSERHPDKRKMVRIWLTGQISVQDDE